MTLSITSAFDGGNIAVLSATGDTAELEIVKDNESDFYQWFYFRVTGCAGKSLTLTIANAGGSAYPQGWDNYQARVSTDREQWRLADTDYADGTLTIRHKAEADSLWFAYFAPYTMERHYDLVTEIAGRDGVCHSSLGLTLDGRELDYFAMGTGDLSIWLYARQHPGETMAEWWMEGALDRLTDPADPVARVLRDKATFHVIPNMNPDGSFRGHLRTNAVGTNLNREWHEPTPEKSPEVLWVRNHMDKTGVDFAMDVHGDEAIPANFIAGFEGIPSWTERQGKLYDAYLTALLKASPDFQTKLGYPIAKPRKGNLSMSTNQVAERFDCVAMTLEMPFKDNHELPDDEFGWSPERCALLGRACLSALLDVIDDLRD
ncbi:M14-type cytosolic carboxypeptidase [Parasphingopyxis sp.]|uniref:M14 family metallopeptidase n=1 Tax=Parasphingopyxis sp. TaxID=1920299 RepID=UPI002618FF83|nr:M14-type cytosolic carboxypeptidase [Parasphingopyxis sp.]